MPHKECSMVSANPFVKLPALILSTALIAAACGSTSSQNMDEDMMGADDGDRMSDPITIENDGTTALEGHTPRGFAGSGVGLFAGDNLNSNFPNGEGLQILLSFEIPNEMLEPNQATLTSEVLSTSGNVFEALGELQAAPVSYEAFGPELFDIATTGEAVTCERPTETSLECDVTEAAQDALSSEATHIQLRLTLEQLSDNDGEQDLVLFNNGDSNVNEPGLFTLELN